MSFVEQWEDNMAPNHSKFHAIEEEQFLLGTRLLVALEKVGSYFLKKELRRDTMKFLEDFVNCVLSTVAIQSVVGRRMSCFCLPIVVVGDNHIILELFGMMFYRLFEKGWLKGTEMESCISDNQSFVQEQRQLEWTSTKSGPDVGNVLSFCPSQASFRVQHYLCNVCFVSNCIKFSLLIGIGSFVFGFKSFN